MQIAVVNRSALTDAEARLLASRLDTQVQANFSPVWGMGALVSFVDREHVPEPTTAWLLLTTTSDEATAEGYHDLGPSGQPMSKVFVDTCKMDGTQVSWAASWEMLGLVANPALTECIEIDDAMYAIEPCAPCGWEGYDLGDTTVANFVYPAYYFSGPGERYDHLNKILEPSQLLPGGYAERWVGASGWRRLGASQMSPNERPRVGSRPERRRTPRGEWQRSAQTSLPVGEEVITG